jgi:hypothetical protein
MIRVSATILLVSMSILACARSRQNNSSESFTAASPGGVPENPRSLKPIIPAEISCIEDPNTEKWNYTVRVTGAGSCEMIAAKGMLASPGAEACKAETFVEEGGVRYQIAFEPSASSTKRFMNVWFKDGNGEGPAQLRDESFVILKCGFLSGGGLANPEANNPRASVNP